MTQFPQAGYYDPNMQPAQPATRSGLSVTALVMSLIGLVPCLGLITGPIGVLLGLIGVVSIKPPRTGKGMALAAVILGVIITSVHVWGAKMVYDFGYGFYAFMMKGPEDALNKRFAGDIAGFKAEFHGAGAIASDGEAQAFIDVLRAQYGSFASAAFDQKSGQQPPTQPGQAAVPLPFVLTFANKTVNAEVELVFGDQKTGAFFKKIGYIKVLDPAAGDPTYPLSAAPSTTSPPTPPASPPAGATDDGTGTGPDAGASEKPGGSGD